MAVKYRLLFLAVIILALITLTFLGCSTTQRVVARVEALGGWQGTVTDVRDVRTLDGSIFRVISFQFDDQNGVHQGTSGTFPWGSREFMLFGVIGRSICVRSFGKNMIRLESWPCR